MYRISHPSLLPCRQLNSDAPAPCFVRHAQEGRWAESNAWGVCEKGREGIGMLHKAVVGQPWTGQYPKRPLEHHWHAGGPGLLQQGPRALLWGLRGEPVKSPSTDQIKLVGWKNVSRSWTVNSSKLKHTFLLTQILRLSRKTLRSLWNRHHCFLLRVWVSEYQLCNSLRGAALLLAVKNLNVSSHLLSKHWCQQYPTWYFANRSCRSCSQWGLFKTICKASILAPDTTMAVKRDPCKHQPPRDFTLWVSLTNRSETFLTSLISHISPCFWIL